MSRLPSPLFELALLLVVLGLIWGYLYVSVRVIKYAWGGF